MKRIIRKIFNRFGYEIIKTTDWFELKKDRERKVVVWGRELIMPGNNTLIKTYREFMDFNAHLNRIACCVAEQYPTMTVVDVGANVGDTIAIIKSVKDLFVIGIEGDEITFSYLKRNVKQFSNVVILNTYLSDESKKVQVLLENQGTNTTLIPMESGGSEVAFKTLDEILLSDEFGSQCIKLIKIDAEGFDTIILRGAYRTIEQHKPVLFFEYNRDLMKKIQEDGLSAVLSLKKYGYNKIGVFDYLGRLLLVTTYQNPEIFTYLHNYGIGEHNLFGYYDICIFHQEDDELADRFFKQETALLVF